MDNNKPNISLRVATVLEGKCSVCDTVKEMTFTSLNGFLEATMQIDTNDYKQEKFPKWTIMWIGICSNCYGDMWFFGSRFKRNRCSLLQLCDDVIEDKFWYAKSHGTRASKLPK